VRGGWFLPAHHLKEAPGREQSPHAFKQQEAELILMPGQDRKDRGADEIEDQVEARALAEQAELRGRVGGEDEQGAGYLDRLIDGTSLRR
jgi:hypothetical protein